MSYKRWEMAPADKEKAAVLSEKFNIDPFISFMLVSRGIDTEAAFAEFISNSARISDPFRFKDMDKAVERIESAIEKDEKITVYGDYDCDGVTATVLLYSFLNSMGADVDYYIPSRESEGYGMNVEAVDKICSSGTKLIITVDNGIAAFEEIKKIYENGADAIITDHHKIEGTIPKCTAVINPHRDGNDIEFSELSGVAVALKLAGAYSGSMEDVLFEYADLVALGTVSDIMPLIDENRVLVKIGIQKINENPILGIEKLKEISGFEAKYMNAQGLAFGLCPRINAAGRMGSAEDAVRLLLSENTEDAEKYSQILDKENNERKGLEITITEDIEKTFFEKNLFVTDRVIVACGENFHKGVIGIAAAQITQKYNRPSIVISTDESKFASASARSVEGFNIFDALSACSTYLVKFGGHALAAGFTIEKDKIEDFKKAINNYAMNNYEIMPSNPVHVDCRLSLSYADLQLAKNLSILEPCGNENPNAVFALTDLTIAAVSSMGNKDQHLQLRCEKKGKTIRIVKFGTHLDEFPYSVGDKIDAAVNLSVNIYKDKEYLSVKAIDIKKHGIDDNKYFNEKNIFEMFLKGKNNDKSVYPDRKTCAAIYRLIRAKADKMVNIDDLYFLLYNNYNFTYGQVSFALSAFYECGLVKKFDERFMYVSSPQKADLENCNTMRFLKKRLNIG